MGIGLKAGRHVPSNADLSELQSDFASQVTDIQLFCSLFDYFVAITITFCFFYFVEIVIFAINN